MAYQRTTHTLNYRRASTNYSCRSYNEKIGPYGIAFRAGGQTCYAWVVGDTSPYASHLRILDGGVTRAVAKYATEFNPTFTSIGSVSPPASPGTTSETFTVSLDYDNVAWENNLYNVLIEVDFSGWTGTVVVKIDGTDYTIPNTGGTFGSRLFRIGTAAGGPADHTIIMYAATAGGVGPDPDPVTSYTMRGYRIVPWT